MFDAEHAGHREAIDVGVDDTDPQAVLGHGGSEVDGHRGLADPTLARGHAVDPGQAVRLGEGDLALGIAAAVLAITPLSRVLHPHDLVDAFPAPLQRSAALIGAALNLVPAMARNAVAISEAQRMRGSSGARLRDWHAVAAPVVLSALDDSLQLAEAKDSRGFGNGRRSQYRTARMGVAGAAVIAAAVSAVALIIAARVAGTLPDWYPFPVATVPAVDPMPVVACLLLAVPLIAWHRS